MNYTATNHNHSQIKPISFIAFEKHPEPKGKCPECGHEKVFRYYKELSKEYGKCDREFKCGYHKSPDDTAVYETVQKRSETVEDRKIIYPEPDLCLRTLNNSMSAFHLFMERTLNVPETHLRKWNVGTKGNDIETAFIYRNRQNKDVNIVYIAYGKDCKRSKSKPPYSLSSTNGSRYSLCLYGEHLLTNTQIICLVESEKTAVIASYFYPQFDWLATGGKDKLTDEKVNVLNGRKVFYLIDADKKENCS